MAARDDLRSCATAADGLEARFARGVAITKPPRGYTHQMPCHRCSFAGNRTIVMAIIAGVVAGLVTWFLVRYLVAGIYTVDQNERAVKTRFGRAERLGVATTVEDPIADCLLPEEKERYSFPQVRVIPPGGPYFKWPWEKVHKVSIATQTLNMAFDPENPRANSGGTILEAVTKDQLNTGLTGRHVVQPPCDEPDRAGGSVAQIARVGI